MIHSGDSIATGRPGLTIGKRLDDTRGKPSGFDYLRISLALIIFFVHCLNVSHPGAMNRFVHSFWVPASAMLVPLFFSLSGFLVAGSLERSATLVNFLGLRILRIFPALCVEVTLSAFILGPIVTDIPLKDYFSSPVLFHYLQNVVGDIHYFLPGVFTHNPAGAKVNSQLWTVPFELECYIALGTLALLGIARHRAILLVVVLVSQLLFSLHYAYSHHWAGGGLDADSVPGTIDVFCFLTGVLVYMFRERIQWNGWIALACFVATWLLLQSFVGATLIALPVGYLTVCLGLMNPRRSELVSSGDYSYGLYIFSMPILQTIAWLGAWTHYFWMMVLVGFPCSALFAVASWHLVEKHCLKLRKQLRTLEGHYLKYRTLLADKAGPFGAPFRQPFFERVPVLGRLASRRP